ncbi:hypothetical protein [Spirochaeta cellobiosiphila]|uniref:hypothetical protein n=1 Tax=Spirochaeta cellobiosiphila TaxID=504483 RepID=UPI000403AA4C|nr:hypothetical protein [Spirochaeta cellobiosiphila]
MGLIGGIVLIVLGGLCLPSLVAQKSPKAKEFLDKITPFQGTLGLVVFVWGLWGIISSILSLGIIGTWPVQWVSSLVANIINFAGGLILGFGMIQKLMLSKLPEEAQAKAVILRDKLVGFQTKIGIVALIFGVWVILYSVLLRGIIQL